mgnify:CR=1 FL=1
MNAEELFALGRAYLRKKAPYLATTIYGLVPEAVKGCGTMAVTSGMVMYYVALNPGHFKVFSRPYDSFWCCVGTGIENHAVFADLEGDFEPTEEGLAKVRENLLKSPYVGRLVANDFSAAIVGDDEPKSTRTATTATRSRPTSTARSIGRVRDRM